MLGEEKKQKDFFDYHVYENLVPKDHLLLRIKKEMDFSFVREETSDLYSDKMGRPSHPPEVIFRMLFLETYATLSDVEVSRQCQYNLLYRYFVGLGIDDSTPDDTTLVVFRRRLGEERFKRLFDRIVRHAQEKKLIGKKLKIVDATHVIADAAVGSTLNLLRQGRRVVLKKLKRGGKRIKSLAKQHFRYKKLGKAGEEEMNEEKEATKEFIKKLKEKGWDEEVSEELEELEKITEGTSKIRSFHDRDARLGFKNKTQMFVGYKVHLSQDEKSEIITSVETYKGNANEGRKVEDIITQDEEKGIKHKAVVGDALYDYSHNYQVAREKKIEFYAPARVKSKVLDKFSYSKRSDQLICKEGKRSIAKVKAKDGWMYLFSCRDCQRCKNRAGCPPLNKGRVRVYVSNTSLQRMRIDPRKRKEALKARKQIERKNGEAKKWHGLSRARYRGHWKMAIQAFLTFIVINAKRIVRLLEEKRQKLRRVYAQT